MGKIWMPGGGGGGASSDECTATKGDVLKGKTAVTQDSGDEVIAGTLELTGNVTAPNVLVGRTYYSTDAKAKYTGTMPDRGSVNQVLNAGGSYTVPAGFHSGSGKVTANSLASQTGGVTAVEGDVLTGKTYWKDGAKKTGTMANQGAKTAALNCGGSYTIPAGYHNGSGKVTANSLASQTGGATAEDKHVLSGKTYWKSGVKRTGAMTVSSVVSFSVAAHSTSQVIATWKNPTKGPYSGVIICGKTGGYPTNKDDNRLYTGIGSNSALGATSTTTIGGLTAGVLYYFRIWVYLTCSAENQYSGHAQTSGAPDAHGRQVFTSSGTFTVPAGVSSIDIHCTGGGGGGEPGPSTAGTSVSHGGNGGGGGFTKYRTNYKVTPGQTFPVTVGAGGKGGNAMTGEGCGGWTYFGTLVTAHGGCGGQQVSSSGHDHPTPSGGPAKSFGGSGGGVGSYDALADGGSRIYERYAGYGGSNGSNGYDRSSVSGNSVECPDVTSKVFMGQGTTTREFGSGTLYSGGGGGGCGWHCWHPAYKSLGGAGGGGDGGVRNEDGTTVSPGMPGGRGTGGGGGGGCQRKTSPNVSNLGGSGGSGNVIIRW